MASRYWLVKAPNDTMADTVLAMLESVNGAMNMHGVEVVEIIPEKRDANWMETELSKRLTQ